MNNINIDSNMTRDGVLKNVNPLCPTEILERQKIISVKYFSFDNKIHQGQLVIDQDLVDDVRRIFDLALNLKFPIHSVIPISDPRFNWDDNKSMEANNSSGFNYRVIAGTTKLSNHATGRAIDINPVQNPYIRNNIAEPNGATFDSKAPGTLTDAHPITKLFKELGWQWGGDWTSVKDYQHFEKPI